MQVTAGRLTNQLISCLMRRANRRKKVYRLISALLLIVFLAGCGGDYKLTVPDQLAPMGKNVVVVARLQRNDFWIVNLSMEEMALRFRLADGQECSAHTDKHGYAAAQLAAPNRSDTYQVTVSLQDTDGEEVQTTAPAYVWAADSVVVAVDLDSLAVRKPGSQPWNLPKWLRWGKQNPAEREHVKQAVDMEVISAAKAISQIAAGGHVLYLTRNSSASYDECRQLLKTNGYPDGPVLRWYRERWHTERGSIKYVPKIVVESRMVSQLPAICKNFPKLKNGICMSALAARAFAEVGMTPIVIGSDAIGMSKVVRRSSWQDLLEKGF